MKRIMWDIDGTLLLTGGAGVQAMKKVVADYYGLADFEFEKNLAGRTDADIIRGIVLKVRQKFLPEEAESLLKLYHELLPEYLKKCRGSLMRNVEKTLRYFQSPNISFENCLLTGNTSTAAFLKLAHYGLADYFSLENSICGELSEDRAQLAKIARNKFSSLRPQEPSDDLIFVGDTPNDVLCARAIGSRCLIVLDGAQLKREDFLPYNPWKILDHLPDDPRVLEKMFNEE